MLAWLCSHSAPGSPPAAEHTDPSWMVKCMLVSTYLSHLSPGSSDERMHLSRPLAKSLNGREGGTRFAFAWEHWEQAWPHLAIGLCLSIIAH